MKKLMILTAMSAAFAFGQAGAAAGAHAGGKAAQVAIQQYLGLSDTQVSGLQQIRQTAQTQAKPLRDTIRAKAQLIQQQNQAATKDPAALGQAMIDLREARKQLAPIRDNARTQALAVLTPDQKTKLDQLKTSPKARRELRQAIRLGLLNSADASPVRARIRARGKV